MQAQGLTARPGQGGAACHAGGGCVSCRGALVVMQGDTVSHAGTLGLTAGPGQARGALRVKQGGAGSHAGTLGLTAGPGQARGALQVVMQAPVGHAVMLLVMGMLQPSAELRREWADETWRGPCVGQGGVGWGLPEVGP